VADRKDEQIPEPTGRGNCTECGKPLAPDQRYCLDCGHRRGLLPGAVAATIAATSSKAKDATGAPAATGPDPKAADGEGGWSWMPSPQAIAIAVIGMLALGVGLGSAMSEIASSAPLSTILLEYPGKAAEASAPAVEPEAEEVVEEEPVVAAATAEEETVTLPEETLIEPLAEEPVVESLPEEPEGAEEKTPLQESLEQVEKENEERELEEAEGGGEALPEVKHAWLIVLGENSYESTFGASAGAPYLSRVLPKKGELIPNYYGVTGGVLANEIALLSGQGPTPETAVNCPDYAAIAPATVSLFAEQVEGNGCVYPSEVESLPTQLTAKEVSWRAYVEDMENGTSLGQTERCRKPALGGLDYMPTPQPGDQYTTWRNPVVYFAAIAEGAECEKHDVGFEILSKDLAAKKKTPALSLIFPDACHSGGEFECEPGAPKGAQGAAALLKTLVPAIMASPAYEEGGGLIMITSAQAPQAGEHPDPSACCLAPEYPNLPPPAAGAATTTPSTTTATTEKSTSPTVSPTAAAEEETAATTAKYSEESLLESGGGGKVGLLLISPLVLPGSVVETEYANHFTLLKTLETMFGVEPLGYASEEEVPTLSPELFVAAAEETGEEEAAPAG
jgi:phosphatidylinositol-3-phosphatase